VRAILRRTATTLAATFAVMLVAAPPASAHTVSGAGAGNFRTTLTGLAPAVPGLTVKVVENGSRLSLTNTTGTDAVVLGYSGEPYLRVGPDGVWTNAKSPATYVNASRTGRPVPPTADAKAAPVWTRVDGGHTALWHDHRIHWMGSSRPPAVTAQPKAYHLISDWTVPVSYGTQRLAVTGRLAWVPGPSPVPWYGLALVAFAAVLLAGRARPRPAVAVATGLVVLTDMVHTIGLAAVNAGPWTVAARYVLTTSGVSVLAWVVGVAALVLAARRRDLEAGYLAAFAGAAVAMIGGLFDLATLSASTPPFALAAVVARLAVALSVGAGLGLAAAVVLGTVSPKAVAPPRGPDGSRRSGREPATA
jgi:hypothetical protein